MDVNDAGQAVGLGNAAGASYGPSARLWESDDTPRDLGNPPGYPSAFAEAINNAGHVVGFAQAPSLPTRAVLWMVDGSGVTQMDITPSGAEFSRATDLTEVVGGVFSAVGTTKLDGTYYRTVWTLDAVTGDVLDIVYGPESSARPWDIV